MLGLAVALPFVAALLVMAVGPAPFAELRATAEGDLGRAERVRWIALVLVGLSLAALVLAAWRGEGALLRLGPMSISLDGPAALLAPSYLLAALLATLAAPRRSLTRATSVALAVLGAALLVTLAGDAITLALGWALGVLIPLSLHLRSAVRGRRVIVGFGAARVLLLVAGIALGVWAAMGRGDVEPFSLDAVVSPRSPFAATTLVLVTLAALARMAVFPFHLWLMPFADAAPPLLFVVKFAASVGLVVLIRLALPLATSLLDEAVPFVAIVGLLAALHAALRAVGETRLRRVVALLTGSQLGIVVVGASALGEQAATGAVVGAAAVALGTSGLLVVVNAVEARLGPVTLDRRSGARGLAEAMPKAALAWFVVAFTTVAIPGSLAFVAEDLVLHGLLAAHPVLTVLMLLASILNAVTLMRAGASLFLGPPADAHTVPDLLMRERVALVIAFSLLVGAGLAPSPAVDFARRAVHAETVHGETAPEHAE
jgi:NADH-quinone oxidoreductase subunit M